MRIAYLLIIFLHGLIHLLGFVKGFEIKEVKELTLPISKSTGLMWLSAAILLLIHGVLFFVDNKYAWLIGVIAVILSQILIIVFWKDAKFGTLLNIIILIASIISFGSHNFQELVQQETTHLLSQSIISKEKMISENDIKDLPDPVKKWLRHSGVMGKPFISIGKVLQQAEMKMKPDQQNWMSATALQYSTIDSPAFIWTVDVKMNSFLNFHGRDKFENGKGEMMIKINSLFNVVNEQGEKLNEGTTQRFLAEMVWFPSLSFSPYITWEQINNTSAKATMDYKGVKGSGTFYFNTDGDFVKFTALRFMGNETDAKRYEWVLLVNDYKLFEGIKVPTKMTATWKLEEGDWTWLKLEITDIKYNENANH